MLKLLRHPLAPDVASGAFVWTVGALVGRQAALGMDSQQWMAGAASICGAILVAVMVRTRPTAERAGSETGRGR